MSHLQICKKIHKNKYNATNTPMTAHFIFIQQVNHWFCLITTGSSNNITSRIYLAWLGMSERVSPKHYIKTSKAWHVSSVLKHNLQYLGKTAIYWQRKLLTPTVNHFPVGWPLWVKKKDHADFSTCNILAEEKPVKYLPSLDSASPKTNLANLFRDKHFGPQPELYCANQKLISSSKGAYNLISCLTWSHFGESQRWNSIMMETEIQHKGSTHQSHCINV